MAKTISIKRSLLVNFLLVIVLLGGAITAITFLGNRQTVRTLSTTLISQSIDHVESKLEAFFEPVIRELLLARSWGEQGVLNLDKPEKMRPLFVPLIKDFRQVSSMLIADRRGREFMLFNRKGQWINRITKKDKWGSRSRFYTWRGNERPKAEWRTLNYDPRQRPWYRGALRELLNNGPMTDRSRIRNYLHWTRPYPFFSTKEPGITASIYYTGKDGIKRVIGFDILLNEISRYTMNLKVSKNGKVFVLTDDLKIIGLPRTDRKLSKAEINKLLLKSPSEMKDPLFIDALEASTDPKRDGVGVVRFISRGKVWLGEFRSFDQLSVNRRLWIAALVPESDVVGNQSQLRVWIIAITLTVMIIAITRAYMLARGYSNPINFLMKQSERISRGMLYQGDSVDSGITEIQRLADAHEKMRVALKSLLKLERDLQLARQIQQNTFPKDLPQLQGYDIDAWSQPAEETGGDTYDVIGYRYTENDQKLTLTNDHPDYAFFLMADATGHGIGPALSANEVRSMLRMAVRTGESLENIALHINQQLFQDLHAGRFITAWLCELDAANGCLNYFSAGQAPLFHFHSASGEFSELGADSPPFGIMPDLVVEMPEAPILEPGDLFIVLSDGVYEATDSRGKQFGLENVLDILKENAALSCGQILLKLRHALEDFTGDTPANDDRTAILIKREAE